MVNGFLFEVHDLSMELTISGLQGFHWACAPRCTKSVGIEAVLPVCFADLKSFFFASVQKRNLVGGRQKPIPSFCRPPLTVLPLRTLFTLLTLFLTGNSKKNLGTLFSSI